MRFRNLIAILGMGLALTACADLFTVNYSTEIPDKSTKQPGTAIHLDAQQRLFVATARGYCAEPSPDALASYAASLGFDLDIFSQGSGSLAQALKNDAASIGLRTQSITLMRDALYRMCEASSNGHLNKTEVAAFLRRSQDLTAVVLATEQLTGAVAANQVILTPSAIAGTSANLLSNQQLLDQMEKNIQEKEKAFEDARSNLAAAEAEPSETDAVKTARTKLKAAQERLEDAKEVRDKIKVRRDAALTNPMAQTTGTGEFSRVIQLAPMDEKTTKTVADAVKEMVQHVLNKSYTPDVCLSHLISSQDKIRETTEDETNNAKKISGIDDLGEEKKNMIFGGIMSIPEIQSYEKKRQALREIENEINKKTIINAVRRIYNRTDREISKINEINTICKNILKKIK